mmetsp:Transcript_32702/g.74649  ORF Transcript_32702/g.74649 Transcript_32702/m.74649 type:complete len:377 (-) Transcript_32702:799-1929(-)
MVQVLLVKGLDVVPRVLVQDTVRGEKGRAVVGNDAVHCEAAGQASHAAERGLKRLLEVVGVVVLEDLDHGHPGAGLVVHLRLAAESQDLLLLVHPVDHVRDAHGVHSRVGVDSHQEPDHVRLQVQVNHRPLYRRVKLGELPPVVDAVVVPHHDELGVPLAAIARLGRRRGLLGEAALDNRDVLEELVPLLEDAVVDAGAILRVDDADAVVLECVVLELIDVETKDVREMLRRGHVLAVTSNETVSDHEKDLVLVRIGRIQHTLDRLTKLIVTLIITGHHDHYRAHDVLLRVGPVTGTDVDHTRKELHDHEQRHEHKHAVHHNIQGGAERVVLVVEQAVVEHFLEARDVLGRTEERLVQLGGVPAEGVHDDPVQGRR